MCGGLSVGFEVEGVCRLDVEHDAWPGYQRWTTRFAGVFTVYGGSRSRGRRGKRGVRERLLEMAVHLMSPILERFGLIGLQ